MVFEMKVFAVCYIVQYQYLAILRTSNCIYSILPCCAVGSRTWSVLNCTGRTQFRHDSTLVILEPFLSVESVATCQAVAQLQELVERTEVRRNDLLWFDDFDGMCRICTILYDIV